MNEYHTAEHPSSSASVIRSKRSLTNSFNDAPSTQNTANPSSNRDSGDTGVSNTAERVNERARTGEEGHLGASVDRTRLSVQNLPLKTGVERLYTVNETDRREAFNFGAFDTSYSLEMNHDQLQRLEEESSQTPFELLLDILQHFLTTITRHLEPDDLIQLNINAPGRLDYPIALPTIRVSMLTLDLLIDATRMF